MVILGIDPGSRKTGWGVIRQDGTSTVRLAGGTIRLRAGEPLERRLVALGEALEAIVAGHAPEACAVEAVFAGKSARSALVLGHARGVALWVVARAGVPLFEYPPSQVKQAVAGVGGAEKAQVAQMVAMLLGHRAPLPEDEADALALALTHAAAARMRAIAGDPRAARGAP